MKYRMAIAIVVVLAAGTFAFAKAQSPAVGIHLTQTAGNADMYYFTGPMNVQYALQIDNQTNDTYQLTRINLHTQGPGAYTLRTGDSPVKQSIPPGVTTITVSAWARARGGFIHADEPVSVLGTAWFSGPNGSFVKQFSQFIPQ